MGTVNERLKRRGTTSPTRVRKKKIYFVCLFSFLLSTLADCVASLFFHTLFYNIFIYINIVPVFFNFSIYINTSIGKSRVKKYLYQLTHQEKKDGWASFYDQSDSKFIQEFDHVSYSYVSPLHTSLYRSSPDRQTSLLLYTSDP